MRITLVVFLTSLCALSASAATTAIPKCRLDDALAPIVETALEWARADLTRQGSRFPFEQIVVNPTGQISAKTLAVYIVKDATKSSIDDAGCIRRTVLPIGRKGTVATDGECLATDLSKCSKAQREYMAARLQEIHGGLIGDSQTGYEFSGGCYLTNLHACLREDRNAILRRMGARDDLSVRGGCVASANAPPTIRCSAGALKMLLSHEAAQEKAPTLGLLFILSHELAHLALGSSSTFDGAEHVLDLSWAPADKLLAIRQECERGESLRQSERDADALALKVARTRLPEIAERWPKQGSMPWLITQAGHYALNLVRWNNDWQEGPEVETPRVFLQNPDGGTIMKLSEEDMRHIDDADPPSGRSEAEVEAAAKAFVCGMLASRKGHWDVLIQSGTTHGSMPARLMQVLATLRPAATGDDPISKLEGMVARFSDYSVRRHTKYLAELEGAICRLAAEQPDCSGGAKP